MVKHLKASVSVRSVCRRLAGAAAPDWASDKPVGLLAFVFSFFFSFNPDGVGQQKVVTISIMLASDFTALRSRSTRAIL